MSVSKRKNGFYIMMRPFGGTLVGVKTSARTKSRAKEIETMVLMACKSADYRALDPESREICVRMFQNQGWAIPDDLRQEEGPSKEMTLWRAVEIFLNYPSVIDCKAKERYIMCLKHLVKFFSKEKPIKDIWAPEIRMYQNQRLAEGARPTTVNWETGTLSRLFGVMVEMQVLNVNPVRLVKQLSRKSSEREAYISKADVQAISNDCPEWFRPIIWTAYYTGMRRGEIVGFKRRNISLKKRIITISPEATKEGHWKRVPNELELVPILQVAMGFSLNEREDLFTLHDSYGVRPLKHEAVRNPWRRACAALKLKDPWPRFHDLRHTWKTNARRSGMDPEIRESILGHSSKQRMVSERYGRISAEELVSAIDSMTFDHGDTEILVSQVKRPPVKSNSRIDIEKMLTGC